MTIEKLGKKAIVLDFDNTIINRELTTRSINLIFGKLFPYKLPTISREELSQLNINHNRVEGQTGWKENIIVKLHARRKIFPGIKDELRKLTNQGVDVYGNTGRPNRANWVDMTDEALHKEGIRSQLKRIFYTPEQTRPVISKAHALYILLKEYDEIEFYDDNPRTASFIARIFPEIKVNLVQHKPTDLLMSKKELKTIPNLRQISEFKV